MLIYVLDARIRARVYNVFRSKFLYLEAAEVYYQLTLTDCLEELELSSCREDRMHRLPPVADKMTQTPALVERANQPCVANAGTTTVTNVEDLKNAISVLDDGSLSDIAVSFLKLAVKNGIDTNPADFASQSIRAMKRLQEHGKNTLLYKFCFAWIRCSLVPIKENAIWASRISN